MTAAEGGEAPRLSARAVTLAVKHTFMEAGAKKSRQNCNILRCLKFYVGVSSGLVVWSTEQGDSVPGDVDDFVRQIVPTLLRLAGPMTPSRADAEDLAQETLTKLVRHWRRVAAADHPEAYARKALFHEAIKQSRRRGRVRLMEDVEEVAPETRSHAPGVLDRELIRSGLACLPPRHRAAVVLRYLDDGSYADIAEALGCREATARSWVNRGLMALRAHYEQQSQQ